MANDEFEVMFFVGSTTQLATKFNELREKGRKFTWQMMPNENFSQTGLKVLIVIEPRRY